jgi:Carboxypeptidase regulatory-like domain
LQIHGLEKRSQTRSDPFFRAFHICCRIFTCQHNFLRHPRPLRRQPAAPATPTAPGLPATTYLADVRQGGNSVYDNGLTIGSQAGEPIEIHVNTNAGSIQGAVLGPDQKPVPSTLVVLVPPESRRQNPALYRTARTDAQGRFVINTVPPGTYTLFAWESVLTGAWQSAEFLRSFADRGVPASVSAAERANVNVGLIKDRQ